MNNSFLAPPPVRLNQALQNEGGDGGGAIDRITRRKFLKRTGGATVAAMVAWNLATNQAYANEEGEGSSWGMICLMPDLSDSPKQAQIGPVNIPQQGGGAIAMTILVEAATGKFADPLSTPAYNSSAFSGTCAVDVYVGGSIIRFAAYYADYAISCTDDGAISGTVSNRPWLTKNLQFHVGTEPVEVIVTAINPPLVAGPDADGKGTLFVKTGVKIQFAYYDWSLGSFVLSSLNPDTFQVVNYFVPKKK